MDDSIIVSHSASVRQREYAAILRGPMLCLPLLRLNDLCMIRLCARSPRTAFPAGRCFCFVGIPANTLQCQLVQGYLSLSPTHVIGGLTIRLSLALTKALQHPLRLCTAHAVPSSGTGALELCLSFFFASVPVNGAGGSTRPGKRCFEDAGYAARRSAIKQKRMTLDCVVALRQSRVMDGTWALPSVITSVFY